MPPMYVWRSVYMSNFLDAPLHEADIQQQSLDAKRDFLNLIQPNQYVGEVYSLGYETALVMIHDYYRREVGGIPSLSFLIATRVSKESVDLQKNLEDFDHTHEDSSVILLRVMDAAKLPSDDEALRVRVQSAQTISGTPNVHWDSQQAMDSKTNYVLSFAGIQCRVIGTFYLDKDDYNSALRLKFGSDISNYYPNRGLKVYKPNKEALEKIVGYTDSSNETSTSVVIGTIRYASTNRSFQGIEDIKFSIHPDDFRAQKTALFGMTRTGKSNTTKIILQSVFSLRFDNQDKQKIGQIVFDPNGEYANENVQDSNSNLNPSAIKNIWRVNSSGTKDDVITYGVFKHPNDPNRKLMLINFYDHEMMSVGKDIINVFLESDQAKYVQNFRQVSFEAPQEEDYEDKKQFFSAQIRYQRRVLFYRALLNKAGFKIPPSIKPRLKLGNSPLFSNEILEKMASISSLDKKDSKKQSKIHTSAETLKKSDPSWDAITVAAEGLFHFINTEEYETFNKDYIKNPSRSGESWADSDLERLLEMFVYPKGANIIGKARNQHTEITKTDFAKDIYNDLINGKLVIIDQSSGDPEVNDQSARRIVKQIFFENQSLFREGKEPPQILIYVEEAHNLLPYGTDLDLKDIWVRTAKEGAKYNLGMVYVTQEVSSIQRNILKNTANWFIGHLNNTDETKELRKFYDFADFEASILRAQDKGFLRVKTISNPFVVPVQAKKFSIEEQS